MNFGEWVRREVNSMDKSIAWLLKEINASPSIANKWRKGTQPKTEYFLKVCCIISREKGLPLLMVICIAAAKLGIELDESD